MKLQDVLLKATAKKIDLVEAKPRCIGVTDRTMRFDGGNGLETEGYSGLVDRAQGQAQR